MENNDVSKILSDWLDSYLNFERLPKKNIFWLDTIEFLCNRLNNPQNAYKSIHIAGSKGKGSVSAFVSSIIREAGFSCGLYTSPHIQYLIERITEAGKVFPEKVYDESFREMVPRVESIIPEQLPNEREITWFELITLYSFLCFKNAKCTWAVFETGLGGRLDATNIIKPEMCIITPIELEHTEYLGNTIPLIAAEKAGIIKKNTPVFVSRQKSEALDVFKNKASQMNAPLFYYDDFVRAVEYELPDYKDSKHDTMKVWIDCGSLFTRPLETNLRLIGKVQAENAALAAAAVKHLMPDISEEVIERGLSKAELPGRFEITINPYGSNKMILDGAHTANSLCGTVETFKKTFGNGNLLFACAEDKDMNALVHVILDADCPFHKIYLTRPGELKKSDLGRLSAYFFDYLSTRDDLKDKICCIVEADYKKAIGNAMREAGESGEQLLVTGSFYLVSEVKQTLSAFLSKSE